MKKYYPLIDVIVLTSISEAQPLVILEGGACGVPSVATDVGSCRDLLEGTTEEDKKLGHSGIVTSFHSSEQTASALYRLLSEDDLYEAMSEAAQKRAELFYTGRI
jgi:glycosyltransferase involved in cell wall biosynthesis